MLAYKVTLNVEHELRARQPCCGLVCIECGGAVELEEAAVSTGRRVGRVESEQGAGRATS